jgi:Cys-rich repeat protein
MIQVSKALNGYVCDTEIGSCVECVTSMDCSAGTPVCDTGACRTCTRDNECSSGACGEDGSCVDEADIAYVDPLGTATGDCTRAAPCNTISRAISVTTNTRNHVVLTLGTYIEANIRIASDTTPALEIFVHGSGATVAFGQGDGEAVFNVQLPTTIRDLDIAMSPIGRGILAGAATLIERTKIQAPTGIEAQASIVVRDVVLEARSASDPGIAGILINAGSAIIERTTSTNGDHGIRAAAGATVDATNVLIYRTLREGIQVAANVSGSLNFVTIAETGSDNPPVRGLTCGNLSVRSTIIWTRQGVAGSPVSTTCTFVSSIAGPTTVNGATNADPLFVSPSTDDYRLTPRSPAIDVADAGPSVDDPRPRGAGFDIGAYERQR